MSAPQTEATALRSLGRLQTKYLKAEQAAADLKAERDAMVLSVRDTHGTGYVPLAEALGLTKDRVAQVLGEQRRARAQSDT